MWEIVGTGAQLKVGCGDNGFWRCRGMASSHSPAILFSSDDNEPFIESLSHVACDWSIQACRSIRPDQADKSELARRIASQPQAVHGVIRYHAESANFPSSVGFKILLPDEMLLEARRLLELVLVNDFLGYRLDVSFEEFSQEGRNNASTPSLTEFRRGRFCYITGLSVSVSRTDD